MFHNQPNQNLSRKDFDPIFTEHFFNTKKRLDELKEEKEEKLLEPASNGLDFPLPSSGTAEVFAKEFKQFFDSDQGAAYKKGVRDIIDSIIKVINSWDISDAKKKKWIENLNDFYRINFQEYSGAAYIVNKEKATLYIDGVKELKKLSQRILDKNISLSMRQAILHNLLSGTELHRCGAGTAGFIKNASELLGTNPDEMIEKIKHDVVLQLAEEKFKKLNIPLPQQLAIGYETHYANYVAHHCANTLGFSSLPDEHFNFVKQPENKGDELLKQCIQDLPKTMNLPNVIEQLVNRFDLYELVSDLQAKLSELQKTEVNPSLLFTSYYEAETQELQKKLDKLGLDADWVVASLFNLEYDDTIHINLKPNAYEILEISIINRLFVQGYLNDKCKHEFVLPNGEKLFIVTTEKSGGLAFIEKTKDVRAYQLLSNYFATLPDDKQKDFVDLIVDLCKQHENIKKPIVEMAKSNEKFYLMLLQQGIPEMEEKASDGVTSMFLYAASKGYLNIVKYLAKNHPQVLEDRLPSDGSYAIHLAALNNQPEIIKYLLQNFGNQQVLLQTNSGLTAFDMTKNLNIINLLVTEGWIPTDTELNFLKKNAHHHEALYEKCLKFNLIDIKYKNSNGQTPIMLASLKGYKNIVSQLVAEDKSVLQQTYPHNGAKVLHFAAYGGNIELIKYLVEDLKVKFEPNRQGYTPLWYAFENHHMEAVDYFLKDKNCKPSPTDKTSILSLIEKSKDGKLLIECLESKLIDIDTKSEEEITPIVMAAKIGSIEAIKYIATHYPNTLNNINDTGSTVLHIAAEFNHKDIVDYLIREEKISPEIPDAAGYSPILYAVSHSDMVKNLVDKYEASYLVEDVNGATLLHKAIISDNFPLFEYLMNKNNVEFINRRASLAKLSALNLAISKKLWNYIPLLIEKGATVDEKDASKILEAQKDNEKLFCDFINKGLINLNMMLDGQSLIVYAAHNKWHQTVEILSKHPELKVKDKLTALEILLNDNKDFEFVDGLFRQGIFTLTDFNYLVMNIKRDIAHPLLLEKIKLLLDLEANSREEKNARQEYLNDLKGRARIMQVARIDFDGRMMGVLEEEFAAIKLLDSYFNPINEILETNSGLSQNTIDLFSAVKDSAYAILHNTKQLKLALDYLIEKSEFLLSENPELNKTSSSSSSSFFIPKKTVKKCLKEAFKKIEKAYKKRYAINLPNKR